MKKSLDNKRIYVAIDIFASGTRHKDFLLNKEELSRVWVLRQFIAEMAAHKAMEFALGNIRGTINNEEFL